jgi:hypothetical protein
MRQVTPPNCGGEAGIRAKKAAGPCANSMLVPIGQGATEEARPVCWAPWWWLRGAAVAGYCCLPEAKAAAIARLWCTEPGAASRHKLCWLAQRAGQDARGRPASTT